MWWIILKRRRHVRSLSLSNANWQLIDKFHGVAGYNGIEELKSSLLHDPIFIGKLAKELGREHTGD